MQGPECDNDLIDIRLILIMLFVYCYFNFRIIGKTLYIRIRYWNKTKAYVSILNKCYIYFRFSEISSWRQVSIKFQALTIWIHKFISWGSWLWSYCSWINNYMCNQFERPSWRGVFETKLYDKVCQQLSTGRWFSSDTPVSKTTI